MQCENNDDSQLQKYITRKEYVETQIEIQSAAYDKATTYTTVVTFGGYAGLFTIWSLTREYLPPKAMFLVGMLLGISILAFVLFEVFKMIVTSMQMLKMRHLLKVGHTDAEFIEYYKNLKRRTAGLIQWIVLPVWVLVLVVSLITGIGAAATLFVYLVKAYCAS